MGPPPVTCEPGCGTPASVEVRKHAVAVTVAAFEQAHPGCDVADAEPCPCGAVVLLVPTCLTYGPTTVAQWRDGVVRFQTQMPWPTPMPYDDEGDL